MRGFKPFLCLLLGSVVCAILSGCAASTPQNGPSALNIGEFTLSAGVPGIAYKQLLIANGGTTPYTWTISAGTLPPGLSLTSDGIIQGTPTTLGNYNFTVQVVDSQTPTHAIDTAPESIAINPPLSMPTSALPSGQVGNPYTGTITAQNGAPPYTYTVAAGNLPPCSPVPPCSPTNNPQLTLTTNPPTGGGANNATIGGNVSTGNNNFSTESPTQAGVFTFTIQATDSLTPPETVTTQFSITVTGRLEGNYAMYFNGFDNGQPFYIAGNIVADGNGHITGGELDEGGANSTGGNPVGVTGTYNIPNGSNTGSLTLNYLSGTYVYNIVLSSLGTSSIILADVNHPNMWGSGQVIQQSTPPISPPTVGNYAFGFFGNDSSGDRYAGAGTFALNGSGNITSGAEDTNDNGTASGQLAITGGSFPATAFNPNSGRGTFSLTVGSNTYNYAYYTSNHTTSTSGVSANLIAVETDTASGSPATLMSLQQQPSAGVTQQFSNATLKGQSIIQMNGVSSTSPAAEIGVAAFDGNGNITGPGTAGLPGYFTDESVGGTLSENSYSGTYSVASNGRVTVNLTGDTYQPVWYLVSTNTAFAVGTDPMVMSGSLTQQTVPTKGFTIANLLGSYLGGTITPTTSSVTNELDVAATPPPGGIWAVISYDTNGPAGILNNQTFTGDYDCNGPGQTACSTIAAQYGRFEVTTTPTQGAPVISIMYVLGAGGAGVTGGTKSGLVSLNAGQYNGTVDPNPRITAYGH